MRITGVEIYSSESNIINFAMNDVTTSDKFLIKTIVGLDATDIVRKFYSLSKDGSTKFYNFSLANREVVFRIQLNPNYYINEDISEIRDDLYRSISSNRSGIIDVIFKSGGAAVAKLSGYLTKFEVPYFSKVPEVQITLNCEEYFLRGYSPVVMEAADLGTSNLIQVSDSISTAPHGMTLRVDFISTQQTFSIRDADTSDASSFEFVIDLFGGFLAGDALIIDSEHKTKQAYIIRGGVTYPIIEAVTATSVWPVIFPGVNELYVKPKTTFTYNYISYYPAFWGL
jgi:hypothetical protein